MTESVACVVGGVLWRGISLEVVSNFSGFTWRLVDGAGSVIRSGSGVFRLGGEALQDGLLALSSYAR
jgi:hypothetical protein